MDLPGKDELAQTYRSASDSELLKLALTYDALTENAQTALRAEFERRGLEPPVIADEPLAGEFQKLVTVQQYRDLAEAQVAKGVLDSAGSRVAYVMRTPSAWSGSGPICWEVCVCR